MKKKVLEVKDLRINFKTYAGVVQAVRGVNFELYEGETLAIVGESLVEVLSVLNVGAI